MATIKGPYSIGAVMIIVIPIVTILNNYCIRSPSTIRFLKCSGGDGGVCYGWGGRRRLRLQVELGRRVST